jgi:hypothetical protein
MTFAGGSSRPRARLSEENRMSPEDVQRCLSGVVDDAVVQRCLATLRADAQWTVFTPLNVPPNCVIQMVYLPTGTLFGFVARRGEGMTWQFGT